MLLLLGPGPYVESHYRLRKGQNGAQERISGTTNILRSVGEEREEERLGVWGANQGSVFSPAFLTRLLIL